MIKVDIERVNKFIDTLTETINNNDKLNDDYVAGYERGMRTIVEYMLEIQQDD